MAVNPQDIINKLNNKVFARTDITTTININQPKQVANEYGETEDWADKKITTTGVVLDYRQARPKYDRQGRYENAAFMLILPIDITITLDTIITYDGNDYKPVDNPIIPLGSVKVFQKVFVSKD